jgi:hypothetical protein
VCGGRGAVICGPWFAVCDSLTTGNLTGFSMLSAGKRTDAKMVKEP